MTTSPAEAFDKIVGAGRGGWCYEMNGLFGRVLEGIRVNEHRMLALGYDTGAEGYQFTEKMTACMYSWFNSNDPDDQFRLYTYAQELAQSNPPIIEPDLAMQTGDLGIRELDIVAAPRADPDHRGLDVTDEARVRAADDLDLAGRQHREHHFHPAADALLAGPLRHLRSRGRQGNQSAALEALAGAVTAATAARSLAAACKTAKRTAAAQLETAAGELAGQHDRTGIQRQCIHARHLQRSHLRAHQRRWRRRRRGPRPRCRPRPGRSC